MSLGYAEKLSYREDVGEVGQKEHFDSPDIIERKCQQLATLIKGAKRILIMTGAGISTSIGIPDFRGPDGVWTKQKYGQPLPQLKTTFLSAQPSLTHMAIVSLLEDGPARYVVSQNVDSLHRRSGVPAEKLAEVHGNCFMERCPICNTYYLRDFEMATVGFKSTGRSCGRPRCRGRLRDFVLDWDDSLPEEQLVTAEEQASSADLVLCLGTSLQIQPICNLPLRTKRAGGKIVIVNLQKTPKHSHAELAVHARCDGVMQSVMAALGRQIPPYVRRDAVRLQCWTDSNSEDEEKEVTFVIGSTHGFSCPMPVVSKVQWALASSAEAAAALSPAPALTSAATSCTIKSEPRIAGAAASSGTQSVDTQAQNRTEQETGADTPSAHAYKRRRTLAVKTEVVELNEAGHTPWHSVECSSTEHLPVIAQALLPPSAKTVWLRLVLLLNTAADAQRRWHQVTLRVELAEVTVESDAWRRGRSGLEAAWHASAAAGSDLSVVSQVKSYGDDSKVDVGKACLLPQLSRASGPFRLESDR